MMAANNNLTQVTERELCRYGVSQERIERLPWREGSIPGVAAMASLGDP